MLFFCRHSPVVTFDRLDCQRMNDLLLTLDLDVLESVLRLIFRRAQQIASNGQVHTAETFSLTPERVRDLVKGWKNVFGGSGPNRLTMLDLVRDDVDVTIPKDLAEVTFQFYRKAATGNDASAAARSTGTDDAGRDSTAAITSAATPAPKSARGATQRGTPQAGTSTSAPVTPATNRTLSSSALPTLSSGHQAEGLVTVNLGNVAESGKTATDLLADAMELHRIPEEEKLHLLQVIRVAMSINDKEARKRMLRLRLLAISVLSECFLVRFRPAARESFVWIDHWFVLSLTSSQSIHPPKASQILQSSSTSQIRYPSWQI